MHTNCSILQCQFLIGTTIAYFTMKTALFNFFVFQIVIWAIVFSTNNNEQTNEVNYASISDTWEVVRLDEKNDQSVVLHYPTFYELTLNIDGTYLRQKNDETFEAGKWNLNKSKSILTLINEVEIQKFEIIQLPNSATESFIIKENIKDISTKLDVKYELTRI